MRHIQAILGHEAIGTTQIYTKVDKDDLKKSLDEYIRASGPGPRPPRRRTHGKRMTSESAQELGLRL
jgi:hypothetical protein